MDCRSIRACIFVGRVHQALQGTKRSAKQTVTHRGPGERTVRAIAKISLTSAAMPGIPPPSILPVTSLNLPRYALDRLPNGMSLYTLAGGTEPVLKLEIVLRAGASYEQKPGVAEVTAALMAEGTQRLSSAALAEEMEFLGATLQTRGGVDTIRVRLWTLTRYFPELIHLVGELIREPAFDEEELRVYVDNKIERLQIDLKKNEILAYRHLTESVFGPEHPYGRNTFPADYQALTRQDLIQHHAHF